MNRETYCLFELLSEISYELSEVSSNNERERIISEKLKSRNDLPECFVEASKNIFNNEFLFESHFNKCLKLNSERAKEYITCFNMLRNSEIFTIENGEIVSELKIS